jgi:hypothetical protein
MLRLHSAKDTQMSMESRGNDNERINLSYQEKNFCQCTSIYHKSRIDRSSSNSGLRGLVTKHLIQPHSLCLQSCITYILDTI